MNNPKALYIWIDNALISVSPHGDRLIVIGHKETIAKATDDKVMAAQRKVASLKEDLTFRLAWPRKRRRTRTR